MTCSYYEINLDSCGLCDKKSDWFNDFADPTNCYDTACINPEDETCSHYEEED